jgi:hypothetical protein
MCETKQRKTPHKVSKLLVGPEPVTMHKHCKLYDDDCFDTFGTRIVADKFSVAVFSASSRTSGTSWFVSEKKRKDCCKPITRYFLMKWRNLLKNLCHFNGIPR